jgi:MOSC domain-containing protein YiiM
MMICIRSVQVGQTAPLGPDGVPSAFVKLPVDHRVGVHALGLVGDEQADPTVHGGPEKAIYGYAGGHYPAWRSEHPEHADLLVPGAFGENLTIDGLDEDQIRVGDVHGIGSALLQVCQPRQPCFKLALHFRDNQLPKAMVRSGRAGWYYRVLKTGTLAAGDRVRLIERPQPAFRFSRLISIINHGDASVEEIASMAAMPQLAAWIRTRAQDRMGRTA